MVSNTATVLRVINEKWRTPRWNWPYIDQLVPGAILLSWRRGYDPGGFTDYPCARSVCRPRR